MSRSRFSGICWQRYVFQATRGGEPMKASLTRILAVAILLTASFALAADLGGSWTGWVTDTACGGSMATKDHAACATKCVKDKGAKWALYTPSDKTVWVLSDQDG